MTCVGQLTFVAYLGKEYSSEAFLIERGSTIRDSNVLCRPVNGEKYARSHSDLRLFETHLCVNCLRGDLGKGAPVVLRGRMCQWKN